MKEEEFVPTWNHYPTGNPLIWKVEELLAKTLSYAVLTAYFILFYVLNVFLHG